MHYCKVSIANTEGGVIDISEAIIDLRTKWDNVGIYAINEAEDWVEFVCWNT